MPGPGDQVKMRIFIGLANEFETQIRLENKKLSEEIDFHA